jgi:hypothetical protein
MSREIFGFLRLSVDIYHVPHKVLSLSLGVFFRLARGVRQPEEHWRGDRAYFFVRLKVRLG